MTHCYRLNFMKLMNYMLALTFLDISGAGTENLVTMWKMKTVRAGRAFTFWYARAGVAHVKVGDKENFWNSKAINDP